MAVFTPVTNGSIITPNATHSKSLNRSERNPFIKLLREWITFLQPSTAIRQTGMLIAMSISEHFLSLHYQTTLTASIRWHTFPHLYQNEHFIFRYKCGKVVCASCQVVEGRKFCLTCHVFSALSSDSSPLTLTVSSTTLIFLWRHPLFSNVVWIRSLFFFFWFCRQ